MTEIFHFFNIKTTEPQKIYDAITTKEGLASWWTTGVDAKPGIGSIAEFKFLPNYHKKMKVTNLVENKLVEWECVYTDDEWIGTTFKFEIIPKEGSTDIKFYHSGWKEQNNFYGVCNYHWGLYMKSLKSLIETGEGTPHIFTGEF